MILRLERREPAHNRQRFYTIAVTRTLFDRWAVVREWGRIGQPGTVRETELETEGGGLGGGGTVAPAEGEAGLSGRWGVAKSNNEGCISHLCGY